MDKILLESEDILEEEEVPIFCLSLKMILNIKHSNILNRAASISTHAIRSERRQETLSVPSNSLITKLGHYFWNSIDAKTPYSFFAK